MQPSTRVSLGIGAGIGAALLLATLLSSSWYHPASFRGWSGFGGPFDPDASGLSVALTVIAGLATIIAVLCGAAAGIGTVFGARRDFVPRLPALLASVHATAAVLFQAISVATWPYAAQPRGRGFGWALPVFFVAGVAVASAAAMLYRDARARARRSAAALAKIERAQVEAELAGLPGVAPDREPVERV